MLRLTYKVVSVPNNIRYYVVRKPRMTSKILPKLLEKIASEHPDESIIYAALDQLEYISNSD